MPPRKPPAPPLESYNAIEAFQAGRIEEAERLLRRALAKALGDREVNHLLALALLHLGRAPEAEYFAGRAIEIASAVPEFHNTLGLALSAQNRHPAAAAAFAKAVELRPAWAAVRSNLAQERTRMGQCEEAQAEYLRGLSSDPQSRLGPEGSEPCCETSTRRARVLGRW